MAPAFALAADWYHTAPQAEQAFICQFLGEEAGRIQLRWDLFSDSAMTEGLRAEIEYLKSRFTEETRALLEAGSKSPSSLLKRDVTLWLWENPNPPGPMPDDLLLKDTDSLIETLEALPPSHRELLNERPELWEMPLMKTLLESRTRPEPGDFMARLREIGVKPEPLLRALLEARVGKEVDAAEDRARRLGLEIGVLYFVSPNLRCDRKSGKVIHFLPESGAEKTACGLPLEKTHPGRRGDWVNGRLRHCKRCEMKGQPPGGDHDIDSFPVFEVEQIDELEELLAEEIGTGEISEDIATRLEEIRRDYVIEWALDRYADLSEGAKRGVFTRYLYDLPVGRTDLIEPDKVDERGLRRILSFIYEHVGDLFNNRPKYIVLAELERCQAIPPADAIDTRSLRNLYPSLYPSP